MLGAAEERYVRIWPVAADHERTEPTPIAAGEIRQKSANSCQ